MRRVLEEAGDIAGRQWRKVGKGWRNSGKGKRFWIILGLTLVSIVLLALILILMLILSLRAFIPKGSRRSLYIPRVPRNFYVPKMRRRR